MQQEYFFKLSYLHVNKSYAIHKIFGEMGGARGQSEKYTPLQNASLLGLSVITVLARKPLAKLEHYAKTTLCNRNIFFNYLIYMLMNDMQSTRYVRKWVEPGGGGRPKNIPSPKPIFFRFT